LDLCKAPCAHPQGYIEIIAILKVLFGLYHGDNLRLECYDISNLSGTLTVGSLVVFQNGKPDKNFYRKFKIKTVKGQNDVAALKEVLSRRLRHTEWVLPDLIILDGGRGQLKAARGVNIPVLGLAKIGKNDGKLFSLYSKNYAQLKKIPPNLSAIFLRLRDEAHRFAITGMRAKRAKARQTSRLEEIEGIGAKRRQKLLARFGGLRGVADASIDDLASVDGISRPLAEEIYKQLH